MSNDDLNDDTPVPIGDLALQTVAMPADTNANGDIFGGWLVSQMDLAGAIAALKIARGRIATVAINGMVFLTPVHVGAVVSCYTDVKEVGVVQSRLMLKFGFDIKKLNSPSRLLTASLCLWRLMTQAKLAR